MLKIFRVKPDVLRILRDFGGLRQTEEKLKSKSQNNGETVASYFFKMVSQAI
jgi:hypothetical protein